MKTKISVLAVVSSLLLPIRGPAQSTVPWSAISMGFVVSSSPTTIVKSIVGQGLLGTMLGTNSIVEGGFLADTLFRTLTSVAAQGGVPKEYALQQNYPNPFNPTTSIRFEIPRASQVNLKVYNVLGQEVMTLMDEEKQAGIYDVQFSAMSLSSGMYLYRLRAREFTATKRLMLLK